MIDLVAKTQGVSREQAREIVADPKYVDRVLAEGAEKARAVARKTLSRVRDAVGLGG